MEIVLRDYTNVTIEQIADEMLKAKVDRNICDSGGAYGTHTDRNKSKDFSAQPSCWYEWSAWRKQGEEGPGKVELMATVSLYHWMVHNLELDVEMQHRFEEYAQENREGYWLAVAEEFGELEQERIDNGAKIQVANTYNFTDHCDLSQTLQYVEVYADDKHDPTHFILSVHGGADVRSGYCEPKCFRLRRDYFEVMDSMCARSLSTTDGDFSWYMDGYSSAEPNDHSIRLFDLPSYQLDWLEDTTLTEFDALLERCARDRVLVKSTNASLDKIEEYIDQIDATVEEVEAEYEARAIELLSEMHDTCTYVKDKKLFLLHNEVSREVEVYAEF